MSFTKRQASLAGRLGPSFDGAPCDDHQSRKKTGVECMVKRLEMARDDLFFRFCSLKMKAFLPFSWFLFPFCEPF